LKPNWREKHHNFISGLHEEIRFKQALIIITKMEKDSCSEFSLEIFRKKIPSPVPKTKIKNAQKYWILSKILFLLPILQVLLL
jgi:hypothetical protein